MTPRVHHKRRLANGAPAPLVDRANPYRSEEVDELSEQMKSSSPEAHRLVHEEAERLRKELDDNL